MRIRLWKGYHSAELADLVASSWREGDLLVLCPPLLRDFSFASCLPSGDLHFHGDFTPAQQDGIRLQAKPRRDDFPLPPRLGVFTSGTLSGTPRLVFYSQRNIESSLAAIFGLFKDQAIDRIFCFPQAFHTFGLVLGHMAAVLLEKELITPIGKYGTHSLDQRLSLRERNILTLGTPTHFFDWLQLSRKQGIQPHESSACIVGGAAVSKSLWSAIQSELRVQAPSIGYGCTEASPGITHLAPGLAPLQDGDIGHPLASLVARVAPDEGVDIEGQSLCLAIVQNGEMQFPRKIRIRDRILVRPDGRWVYQGRTDLVLNRGGAKYSLEEIEARIFETRGLQVMAIVVSDERLGHDLGLAVVDPAGTVDSINPVLKDQFGILVQPANLMRLNEFPLNESAKLDRRAVTQLFNERGS